MSTSTEINEMNTPKPIKVNGHAHAVKLPDDELKDIVISKIKVPREFNIRTEIEPDEKLEALGDSIVEEGLKTPLVVEPTGDGEHYWLRSGFRRHAAIKLKGLRGSIKCIVRHFASPAAAALANAVDNLREDPKSADVAKRIFEFVTGTYPGAPVDEEGKPTDLLDRKEVSSKMGLSYTYTGALVKAWENLSEKVRVAWRTKDMPTDVIREIGKLKTPEEQEAALDKWIASGRRRKKAEKAAKAAAKDGDEAPGRKLIAAKIADWREKLDDEDGRPKIKGRAREIAVAQIDVLRWVYGDIQRPPAFGKTSA